MSNSKELENLVHEYSDMGFDAQDVIMAWFNSNHRKTLILDHLLNIAKEKGRTKTISALEKTNELNSSQALEEQIQKAIQLSLEEGDSYIKPDQLIRHSGNYVGLKNVGNTCYFNSLIQTIFQIKELLTSILEFQPPEDIDKLLSEMKVSDPIIIKRKKGCLKLVLATKKLFTLMLLGNKKILDPSEVTNSLIDAQGKSIKIGEQLDIGEFAINFFERIEEGLLLNANLLNQDNSSFKDLFFGTSKDFITFEWADFKSKKDLDAVFGPINLSITQKDLMASLDSYINFSVDGYQTPNGDITTAKKRIWLTKAPKVLTFILQRSVYDREKGMMKACDAFNFPKEIFIDRFMYSNKKGLKDMLENSKAMKSKLKRIDAEITRIHEFGKNKADLMAALQISSEFIDEQTEEMEQDFIEVNSDASDDGIKCDASLPELKRASDILKQFQESLKKRVEDLEKRKQTIRNKMENSFHSLQKSRYQLHSVVIHEGGINGGHYYPLIYNQKKNKWTKFNDSIVEEITEEEVMKLATGGHEIQNMNVSMKQKPKNPCAYSLFYVESNCEVLDFTPESFEKIKQTLPKEILSFTENENARFMTEYQHCNANLVPKINEEYQQKMNTINFEAAKFQSDLRNKVFPYVPTLPNFNSFLLLEVPKCSEIARWSLLKTIVTQRKIPYNVLEGESKNYYYRELKDLLVTKSSAYNLKSLELSEPNKMLLAQKKKEYIALSQSLIIVENILELIVAKKWKETLATVSLLHEKLGQIKMNDYTNQFYSFASYLLALISLRFCALIDRHQIKADTKEALKLLEYMIFVLNRKDTIKPPEIFYQQIISNLYYTINSIGRKNMKEADLFIFMHHIQKIEEKCEFLPSQDMSTLISPDLKAALNAIENDDSILRTLDPKNYQKLNELYALIIRDKLKIWVEFEAHIRKRSLLVDQDTRMEKEIATWNSL